MTLTYKTQAELDSDAAKAALESELATLKSDCDKLDAEAVRPLRAVAAGTASDEDKTYLANNEASIIAKRARIVEINNLLR